MAVRMVPPVKLVDALQKAFWAHGLGNLGGVLGKIEREGWELRPQHSIIGSPIIPPKIPQVLGPEGSLESLQKLNCRPISGHCEDEPETTCKNWFKTNGPAFTKYTDSKGAYLKTAFRWKYERVHQMNKVQKPYAFTAVAISFTAGKPLKVIRG